MKRLLVFLTLCACLLANCLGIAVVNQGVAASVVDALESARNMTSQAILYATSFEPGQATALLPVRLTSSVLLRGPGNAQKEGSAALAAESDETRRH